MSETPSQHGWSVVNSFAHGRQNREAEMPVPVAEEPEVSVDDVETPEGDNE